MDTLTRMRSFVDVVREGGYSAAARATGRSKAILSKDVRELEDFLGVRLLTRTTRSVAVTEAGQTYFDEALDLLSGIDGLQERMREQGDTPRGPLRISAPRTHSEGLLGETIMAFAAAYPSVQLDVVFEDRFIDMVAERFDVAIRISELADSSLIARKLSPYRVVVCAAPEVLAEHGTPNALEDMGRLPTIADSNHRVKRAYTFDTPEGRRSVRIDPVISINAPHAIRMAALAGLGFCQVPYLTVQDDIKAGRLVPVLEEYELKGVGIYAVYAERRHMTQKLRAFIDFLADQFANRASDCI
ncbi:LysR family transcriptional regulator [Ahrensia marina]|uniref:LysR family transcriptional regulator n=1 Tax=Ahrensia marina TaxID=1514904 RepID=UPI0035D02F65